MVINTFNVPFKFRPGNEKSKTYTGVGNLVR